MDPVIQKCKEILEKHYEDRFAGLILYESQARGQAEAESDIDLLVLLQVPFDYFQEIWNLAELLYPLQLESDRLISVKPVRLSGRYFTIISPRSAGRDPAMNLPLFEPKVKANLERASKKERQMGVAIKTKQDLL